MERSSIILSTEGAYRILSSEIYDILNKKHFKYDLGNNFIKTKYKYFYLKDGRFYIEICNKLAGDCPNFGMLQLYIDLLKNK